MSGKDGVEVIICLFTVNIIITVEPRYNEPLYNKVLGKRTIFCTPVIGKYMEKNLDIRKPHYSEQVLPVP